MTGATRVFLLD